MKLVECDKTKRTVTLEMSKRDYLDIAVALTGLNETYPDEHKDIIGVSKETVKSLASQMHGILRQLSAQGFDKP